MGSLFGDGGAAETASNAAYNLGRVELPDPELMKVQLENLVSQGQLSPEQAQAQLAQNTAMQDISTDPRLKQAQMQALQGLQDTANNDGLSAVDRAQLEKVKSETGQQDRGQRDAILQNAHSRGVGGSGLELMAQLQSQQGSAQKASQMGFDVAAQAQQNKLAALQQAGQLGGQIRGQDFDQQAQTAQAQDAINKFNAANKQQVNLANTSATNQANATNLANKQDVANQNVGLHNQEQTANKNLLQQDFENRYRRAGGQASGMQQAAGQQAAKAQGDKQMAGTAIAAAATYFSDERVKEDVQKFDPSSFLDEITGYKYNYKDPKHGQGPQVGVMAQDIEKGAPQAVSEDNEGTKMVDYNKLGGPILAALADVHHRLKKVEGA